MASFKILLVLLLAILLVEVILAQNSIPDCATKLIPCVQFLNATKPPESCCTPLREVVTNQKACLCNFFSNPANAGLIQSFGINVTRALELPKHCGVSSDTSLCSSAPAPAPGMTPPAFGMTPPPAPAPALGMTPPTSGMPPPPPTPAPAPGMTPPPQAPASAPGMTPPLPAPTPAPGMTPPTSGMTPPPPAPVPTPGMTPPPLEPGATPGMTPPPPGPASAGQMAGTGASVLLLFWVSLMSF